MTIEPRDAVQHGLRLRVTVVMTMRAMPMTSLRMAVLDHCAIRQDMLMYMFVAMFVQTTLNLLLPLFYIIRVLILFSCSRHEHYIYAHQGTVNTVP